MGLHDQILSSVTVPWKTFGAPGNAGKIKQDLIRRLERRLDALDAATLPEALNIPGFKFHKLQGKPQRYTVHVNGPWCSRSLGTAKTQ